MTGTTLTSDQLDARRRRILFRAWRRGTREMDLMIGRYADAHLVSMSPEALDRFEELIDAADTDLFDWVTGARPVPQALDNDIFHDLRAYSLSNPLQR